MKLSSEQASGSMPVEWIEEHVSIEAAQESLRRLINSHFHNKDTARCSIPANKNDDDILLTRFLMQAVKRLEDYDALRAENHRLKLNLVGPTIEYRINSVVAGAYLAAAEQCRTWPEFMLAELADQIRALTPADAERSLQVYAQERVVEEAEWWALAIVRDNLPPAAVAIAKIRIDAATARLAELRKEQNV